MDFRIPRDDITLFVVQQLESYIYVCSMPIIGS
jgi:hypothetical protein